MGVKSGNLHMLVFPPPDLLMEYRILISIVNISTNLKNIDINIDKNVLKNIDIDNELGSCLSCD